jgi:RNA polymerase sigma-70 factor (ECF subfamily)
MYLDIEVKNTVEFPEIYIEDCIKNYSKQIFAYCYRMLNSNKQEAEDAVQEIFMKTYNHLLHNKLPINSIQLWLYKVAHNHCINIIRKQKYISFISLSEDMATDKCIPGNHFEESEFTELIQEALKKLSSVQRTVFILRTVNGYDYKEISIVVKRNPQTVRKQYERAKQKVKNFIESEKGISRYGKYFIV